MTALFCREVWFCDVFFVPKKKDLRLTQWTHQLMQAAWLQWPSRQRQGEEELGSTNTAFLRGTGTDCNTARIKGRGGKLETDSLTVCPYSGREQPSPGGARWSQGAAQHREEGAIRSAGRGGDEAAELRLKPCSCLAVALFALPLISFQLLQPFSWPVAGFCSTAHQVGCL